MLVENLPVTAAELAEAGVLLDRALALEPENGAYLDSKGWWHYRAGALDSARAYLESALESIPSDPAIRDHLEEVLRARKNHP
jgi:tetratricopeptide (TPR) repeat protein